MSSMLVNGHGYWWCCSRCAKKPTRRAIKHIIKRQEERAWKKDQGV